MTEFSRKWEKRIAWTTNLLFLVWVIVFGYIAFFAQDKAILSAIGLQWGLSLDYMVVYTRATVLGSIFFMTLAILATTLMKRRILSGILFLIIAILTFNSGFGLIVIALLYFVVAVMLFVRKEKVKI